MLHITGSKHQPGTVILAAAATPRFYEFHLSLEHLKVPAGSKLSIERGCDIAQNFNQAVKKMTGEWAWFLGDDHAFSADLLFRFLDYEVDVVVPISPTKVAPFAPCVIHGPQDGEKVWHENMDLYSWEELSGEGLMALPMGDFIGQAGMLVRKHVLDRIGYPWFKAGQLDPGRLQEDMTFCRELQQHGFTVWVDREIIFDHYFFMGVTARKHEGKWVPALKSGRMTMVLPDAIPQHDENTKDHDGRPRLVWRKAAA